MVSARVARRTAFAVCVLGLLVSFSQPAHGGLFDRVRSGVSEAASAVAKPFQDLFGGSTKAGATESKTPSEGAGASLGTSGQIPSSSSSAGGAQGKGVDPPSLFGGKATASYSKKLLEQFQAQTKKLPSIDFSKFLSGAQKLAQPFSSISSKVSPVGTNVLSSLFKSSVLIRGELSAPKAGYNETYTIRFDPSSGATRIDFNGGTTSTFVTPLKSGLLQKAEVREERWGERPVRRCTTAPPGNSTAKDGFFSLMPDLSLFSFSGLVNGEGGKPSQRWLHSVSGAAGQLGAAPGESLSFHHELLMVDGVAGIPLPTKYSVSVDSSVLGAGSDSFQHTYHEVLLQPHDSEVFEPKLEACDETETASADAPRFNPLREFTMQSRDTKYDSLINQFKTDFGRQYIDNIEEAIRKNLFVLHSRFVEAFNRGGESFLLELNFLADRLDSEMAILRGASEDDDPEAAANASEDKEAHSVVRRDASSDLPRQFDWRDQGAVTPVQYQGNCASCWAFAVAGAVEGANFVRTRTLVPLSLQALVDCGHQYGARGCRGTWPERAYAYVSARGLPAAADYEPYSAAVGQCRTKDDVAATRIAGHASPPAGNMAALQAAVKERGPAVIVMNAKPKTFVFYKTGVLQDDSCEKNRKDLNHAVLAVGWGEKDGESFLILKNSWSDKWGESGYIRVGTRNNTCGVLSIPYYTVIEK